MFKGARINRRQDRRVGNFSGNATASTIIETRDKTTGPTTLWWKMLARCAILRNRAERTAEARSRHATQTAAIVAPSESSRQREREAGSPSLASAYRHLKSPGPILRDANVQRPTTTAAACSASHPRPAAGRCGIDWPSCPSSEPGGCFNIGNFLGLPFFQIFFLYFFCLLLGRSFGLGRLLAVFDEMVSLEEYLYWIWSW